MAKCKCRWRKDGVVFNESCDKVIRRFICDIDYFASRISERPAENGGEE